MQNKIYDFFGYTRQMKKADEELDEINEAFEKYIRYPSKRNMEHLINETDDLKNVLEGVAVNKHGIDLVQMAREKKNKLVRTVGIIKLCDGNPDSYEKVRYDQ